VIAVVEMVCDACGCTTTLPASDLLVQVDADEDPTGRVILDCPSCGDMSTIEICLRTVATLLLAGAVHVQRLRREGPLADDRPKRARFTVEDVCTWHDLLRHVQSVAPWE
jgi:hypothetical protein